MSLKVIFRLRDVVDLRLNNWIPRHKEKFVPMTICQIRKEAQLENMQEQRQTAQLYVKDNKQNKGTVME